MSVCLCALDVIPWEQMSMRVLLRCVAVRYNVLQCVAVRYSMLKCVAVYRCVYVSVCLCVCVSECMCVCVH